MIAAFSITPVGAGDSVSELVAESVRIVRRSGLASETNSMFTNVEGPLPEVMAVIQQCVEHVAARAPRVSVVVKMDVRAGDDRGGRLESKVAAVERHLSAGRDSPLAETLRGPRLSAGRGLHGISNLSGRG